MAETADEPELSAEEQEQRAEVRRLMDTLGKYGVLAAYGALDTEDMTAVVEVRALRNILRASGLLTEDSWRLAVLGALRDQLADALQQVEEQALKSGRTMTQPAAQPQPARKGPPIVAPKRGPIAIARAMPRRHDD